MKKDVQVTGVATATVNGNGNGNGNGKKVKAETKAIDNVKVIPWDEFDRDNSVKITPHFNQLTTKGVEVYGDLGKLENAKLYIDGLVAEFGGDDEPVAGVIMLLDAIEKKIEKDDKLDSAIDFIGYLQDYFFNWTFESYLCKAAYIKSIRSGNFAVGELIDTSERPQSPFDIYPPKDKLKVQENGLRAEINALAETVKNLQFQMTGKPTAEFTKPADFEGLYLEEIFSFDWMIPNWTLLLEVQQFPGEQDSRVISSVYEKRMDGAVGLDIERLPDSTEQYPYSHEDGVKRLKSETETSQKPQAAIPQGFQKSTRYQLCELISQVFNHPDMPRDLVTDMWNMMSDRSHGDPDTPEGIAMILFDNLKLEDMISPVSNPSDDLAAHLSAILNNPETPESLSEVISNELSSLFDGAELTKTVNSAEFIRKALAKKETALAA